MADPTAPTPLTWTATSRTVPRHPCLAPGGGASSCSTARTWCDHHDQDPLAATRVAIDLWLVDLEHAGLAASSRGTMLTPLRAFYRWLVDEGHVAADPTARVRTPRPEENAQPALTRNQVSVLLAHAQRRGGISPACAAMILAWRPSVSTSWLTMSFPITS